MPDYEVMEVMNQGTIAAASTIPALISGTECEVFNTGNVDDLSLTVEALFATAATGNLILHVVTSPTGEAADATKWDTEDYVAGTLTCIAATRVQKTFVIEADPHFMTAYVVNEDATKILENVIITKVTTSK